MDDHSTQNARSTAMETVRILSTLEMNLIQNQVTEVIRTCFDPEIPVNIY